jgi:hypothetical protein
MIRSNPTALLAAAFAMAPALFAARSLSTDRPDATESPYTVEPGRIQFEVSAAQFTRERHAEERGAPTVETWSFAPLNVRIGLSPHTELQVVHDGQVRVEERDRATGLRTRVDGLGDVTLRFKANLRGNDEGRLGLGVMPYLKLPTAAAGLGNDELEGGLILPLAYELAEHWGFGAMTEVAVVRNDAGTGHRASWLNTATVSRAVGANGGVFAEVTLEVGEGRPAFTFNTGATYAVTDDLQFDLGANVGLTRAADDLTVFAGFSWRY